jgi:hypothetical protein
MNFEAMILCLEAFEIIQFSVKMTLEKFGSEFVL